MRLRNFPSQNDVEIRHQRELLRIKAFSDLGVDLSRKILEAGLRGIMPVTILWDPLLCLCSRFDPAWAPLPQWKVLSSLM
jgi:hypothetical protein